MTAFQIIAIVLTFAALAGYINHRYVKLPDAVGMMALALSMSLVAFTLGKTGLINTDWITGHGLARTRLALYLCPALWRPDFTD